MIAHEVLVVARRDPWREKQDCWSERDGVALPRILRRISPKYQRLRIVVWKNGVRVPKQDWGITRAKAGDIINLRVCPTFQGGGGAVSAMGGLALGGGALALLALFANSNRKDDQNVVQQNTIAPPPENPPDPPLPPVDGYGGAKDTVMPAIMGVSNRKNNWGPIPNVWGNPVKVSPVVVADPFFLVEGNDQWMYVVLSCGIGPLDITDIKIGTKTIEELTTAGVVQWEKREGKPGDINTPLTIYTRDIQTVSPGVSLTTTAQTQTGGQEANELAVDILFPQGLYSMNRLVSQQAGSSTTTYPDTGQWTSRDAWNVSFSIEYRLHGSSGAWTTRSLSTGSQNRTDSFFIGDRWSVATPGLYDVRITRTSSNSPFNYSYVENSITFYHTVTPAAYSATWAQLKSIKTGAPINTIKDANGSTLPLTLIALKIKASELLNGTIDNLTCMVKRYLRGWDGDNYTSSAITNSPAWAFLDCITGFINNSRLDGNSFVDLDAILDWHTFCVSKGFTYNRVVDEFTTIMEQLKEIAAHGRASVHAIDNKFTVVIDRERSTVKQMFTPSTANDLSWELEWPEYPHGVKVKFRNPDADWNVDERTVYADGYDANNATIFETIDYAGLTDSNAAYKHGRYAIASVLERPIKYFLNTDAQALVCNRGELVWLNYDTSYHGLGNGIIKTVTDDGSSITSITFDQTVVMVAGESYGVRIRLSDGKTFLSLPINTVAGETSTLTLTTPISLAATDKPRVGNSIAFGYLNREAADMVLESVEYHDEMACTITMLDYSPGIFQADTGTIPPYEPNVSIPHESNLTIDPPQVTTVITDESVILKQPGALQTRIQISLLPPTASIANVVAQYRLSGATSWDYAGTSDISGGINAVYITGVEDKKTYDVQLKFVGTFGQTSEWTQITGIYVVGKSTPPPDIPYLDIINQNGQSAIAGWKYDAQNGVVVPIDFFCYELRMNPGVDPNWDGAQIIASEYFSTQYNLAQLQTGQITFMVKAKDVAGNLSVNAAVLFKNISGSFVQNLVEQTDYHTAWTGVSISGGAIVGNEIWSNVNSSTFWPALGSSTFWGTPLSSFWNATFTDMIVSFDHTPSYATAKPFNLFLQWLSQNVQPVVEVQRGSQNTFWPSNTAARFWGTASALFWAANSPWQLVPQAGLDGAWEKYRFRLRFAGGTNRAKLQQLSRILDMPDVEELVHQAIVNSGALVLTKSYREIKTVLLSLARDATYPNAFQAQADYPYTNSGPTVRVFDIANSPTSGRVTALVKGY